MGLGLEKEPNECTIPMSKRVFQISPPSWMRGIGVSVGTSVSILASRVWAMDGEIFLPPGIFAVLQGLCEKKKKRKIAPSIHIDQNEKNNNNNNKQRM